MLSPIKVVDLELSRPLETIIGLDGYKGIKGLVRLHNVPIGYVDLPITNNICTAKTISKIILQQHSWKISQHLLQNGLATKSQLDSLRLEDLFNIAPPECQGEYPLVTVAICSRDRVTDLALCLSAITKLDYPNLDILVVDNAPSNDATKNLVKDKYPQIRYVCEPRPGLDWARNRAIVEAKGEIIAYTDDDVIVDPGWVKNLVPVFTENPKVMAVTGLVVPYELETEAQVLFEKYGGFGRGFARKLYRVGKSQKMPWQLLGTGQYGTGANMAFRRNIFEEIGYFDPALDVGTVTNGGGDLEMYFRVVKEGHTLVYEPKALVRHRHRRNYAKLRTQIANNSIGLFSYSMRSLLAYPEETISFLWLFIWWIVYWNLRRLWISFKYPNRFPRDLIWAEFWGCFTGLTRYQQARKNAVEIAKSFGEKDIDFRDKPVKKEANLAQQATVPQGKQGLAVRTVELTQPLQALTDVTDYPKVRVFVKWKDQPLGNVDIANNYQKISKSNLIESIVEQFGLNLLEPELELNQDLRWAKAFAAIVKRYRSTEPESSETPQLPADIPVSIALATYDRPDDLRNCLRCLLAQKSPRKVEIIVVDNHPESGLTPPVVAEFPGVELVQESRQGLAYARNAGIVASSGEIIVATDDDVTVPSDWLEKLLAPFARPDVAIATGNVLPIELETPSQESFENYGGLGRGFEPFEANGDWFEQFPRKAAPTWELGATANAAFRASIFSHPQIGLMEEALGPGMPSGVGEDTYLFYKTLKADYTIVYEPKAYVWHKHRRDIKALRRQIYGYSKGHVSYNLTTWLQDGDWRGLVQILVGLPLAHYYRIKGRIQGWSDYPISLVLLEIMGNLAGPWSLWKSHQRVKKEGRSSPYLPISQPQQTREKALTQ